MEEISLQKEEIKRIFLLHKKKAITLRNSTARERIAKIKKISKWCMDNEAKIHAALKADFGKSLTETLLTEIMPVVGEANYTSKHLRNWLRGKTAPVPMLFLGTSNKLYYEPKGTSLIIAPWNYPFHLCIKPLVSSIAAGNTAILKPSEITENTASLIKEMVAELFDESEVAVFTGGPEVAIALQEMPFNHIFFTGSPTVGKMVMQAASKHLSSITLELGGKSPVIVDKTANIQKTADTLVFGKFVNAGQTCVAPDYVYVHEDVAENLQNALEKAILKFKENSYQNDASFCKMASKKQYVRVTGLINESLKMGAKLVESEKPDEKTRFISPTLLTHVKRDFPIMQEEIFGPVLPLLTYTDIDQVIQEINEEEKPLAFYLFTSSGTFINKVKKITTSGALLINEIMIQTIYKGVPFGGVNHSGIGKSGGLFSFEEFSNLKPVVRNHFAATSLFYPPYTPLKEKLSRFVTKFLV